MQAYAAMCLLAYCDHIHVRHEMIDDLIKHLFSILIAKDLSAWEQAGTLIAITGRGDPIPVEIENSIPENYRDSFITMVNCSVEVGIVDMYGENTRQPREFLNRCIGILQSFGFELPSLQHIGKLARGSDTWGDPVREDELINLMEKLNLDLNL